LFVYNKKYPGKTLLKKLEQGITDENIFFKQWLFVKAYIFIFQTAFSKNKLGNYKACKVLGECFL